MEVTKSSMSSPRLQTSVLSEHQDSKAEFVRSIWNRLGVGDDGYLSLADLTKVCHAIDMENNAKELFTRLDLDGDGRISFGEFLHLFQGGSAENCAEHFAQQTSSASLAHPNSVSGSSNTASVQQCEIKRTKCGSSIGSRDTGALLHNSIMEEDLVGSESVLPLLLPAEPAMATSVASPSSAETVPVWRVLQQWEHYGVSDGALLLRHLGLPHAPHDQLGLQDLLHAVEEECQRGRGEGRDRSRPGGRGDTDSNSRTLCLLLLHETKLLRSTVESAWCERDKLRADLSLTSHRLSSQAQELDDHTMALEATAYQHIQTVEKQHQEACRALQEHLSSEREAREAAVQAAQDAGQRADHLHQQMEKLKGQLAQAEQLCERLDSENSELSAKAEAVQAALADAQLLNVRLQQTSGSSEQYYSCRTAARVAEGGVEVDGADDEEWREVATQLSRLRHENKTLRDANDELLARVDQLTLQPHFGAVGAHHGVFAMGTGEISMDGSCIGDYLQPTSIHNTTANSSALHNLSSTLNTSLSHNYQQPHPPTTSGPQSMPPSNNSVGSTRLKRSAVAGGDEEVGFSSPRDVSSAGRRTSPDLLSPRAGKIARCAVSPPPLPSGPEALVSQSCDESSTLNCNYSCSQPASLDLHLSSLSSVWGGSGGRGGAMGGGRQRMVASTNSVMTSGGLSCSSGSISPCVSAPHSARRGRGLGLEAELAGVRVEVAGLVQQRDHLAACVARLQIQLEGQVGGDGEGTFTAERGKTDIESTQWSEWEALLKKLISEVQPHGGANTAGAEQQQSGESSVMNTPDEIDEELPHDEAPAACCDAQVEKIESTDHLAPPLVKTVSAQNLLSSQVKFNSCEVLAPAVFGSGKGEANSTSYIVSVATVTNTTTTTTTSTAVDEGAGFPPLLPLQPPSQPLQPSSARPDYAYVEADAVSEVSSNYFYPDTTPRRPPTDLQPLFSSLQSSVRGLIERDAALKQACLDDLHLVEREKAELQDRFDKMETEFQSVRAELDKSEEYWLLKLQDEQDYYEEERRVYDENFAKLEAKICEYEAEELNKTAESNKQRLTPIDESILFEQQVNALEGEVTEAQQLLHAAGQERDQALRDAESARRDAESARHEAESSRRYADSACREVETARQEAELSESKAKAALERACRAEEALKAHSGCLLAQEELTDVAEEYTCPNNNETPAHHQVTLPLQESCKQLQAAIHTATAAREELENTQACMQQGLEHIIAAHPPPSAVPPPLPPTSSPRSGPHRAPAHMVPAASVAALLKECREQQRLRVLELEEALTAAHHHLHHHAAQHTQQVRRAERADKLLAELFVENAELMRALQLTEARQKRAEHLIRLRETGEQ